jgi:hypothetical protein
MTYPAPRPHAPGAACKDVGGLVAGLGGGGVLSRSSALRRSDQFLQIRAIQNVLPAEFPLRQPPAVHVPAHGHVAHPEGLSSSIDRQQLITFHACQRSAYCEQSTTLAHYTDSMRMCIMGSHNEGGERSPARTAAWGACPVHTGPRTDQ